MGKDGEYIKVKKMYQKLLSQKKVLLLLTTMYDWQTPYLNPLTKYCYNN